MGEVWPAIQFNKDKSLKVAEGLVVELFLVDDNTEQIVIHRNTKDELERTEKYVHLKMKELLAFIIQQLRLDVKKGDWVEYNKLSHPTHPVTFSIMMTLDSKPVKNSIIVDKITRRCGPLLKSVVPVVKGNHFRFNLRHISFDSYAPQLAKSCVKHENVSEKQQVTFSQMITDLTKSIRSKYPTNISPHNTSIKKWIKVMCNLIPFTREHYGLGHDLCHEIKPEDDERFQGMVQMKVVTLSKMNKKEETHMKESARKFQLLFFPCNSLEKLKLFYTYYTSQENLKPDISEKGIAMRLKSMSHVLMISNGLHQYLIENSSLAQDWLKKSSTDEATKERQICLAQFIYFMDEIHNCRGYLSEQIVDYMISSCGNNLEHCDLRDLAPVLDVMTRK